MNPSESLRAIAATLESRGDTETAAHIRLQAMRVRQIERSLDEICENAAEEERTRATCVVLAGPWGIRVGS